MVAAALLVNRFAETTVRLQAERGHRVVSAGAYRIVRHPMYVGLSLQYPALALLLGSGWAMTIAALIDFMLVWRTAREDSFLRQGASGLFRVRGAHALPAGSRALVEGRYCTPFWFIQGPYSLSEC